MRRAAKILEMPYWCRGMTHLSDLIGRRNLTVMLYGVTGHDKAAEDCTVVQPRSKRFDWLSICAEAADTPLVLRHVVLLSIKQLRQSQLQKPDDIATETLRLQHA